MFREGYHRKNLISCLNLLTLTPIRSCGCRRGHPMMFQMAGLYPLRRALWTGPRPRGPQRIGRSRAATQRELRVPNRILKSSSLYIETRPTANVASFLLNRNVANNSISRAYTSPPAILPLAPLSSSANDPIHKAARRATIHQQPSHAHVIESCQQLHNSVMDLNNRISGPLVPYTNQSLLLPMVLCVGNHSSGKSSFINYVLQRDVQTSGVAPTDDNFTIIAPSSSIDYDQDGFAIIGNPDYGFTSLQQFGPTLQHHTVFKLRKDINANFMIVDSPGMIDAPASYAGMLINHNNRRASSPGASSSANGSTMDRGYDFCGVVKWYADRADVVLLFFDPDKPGTTGETLSILVNALSNIDHKLIIIFNKADQFHNQQIHDFARAYGSLCWNLSKVIPRKDLPRIYTMCLPIELTPSSSLKSNGGPNASDSSSGNGTISPGLQDLYNAREEVVAQVRKAPERRLDNVITTVYDSVSQLYMYARIIQDVQSRYLSYFWSCKYQEILLATVGTACTVGCNMYAVPMLSMPMYFTGVIASLTLVGTMGVYYYNRYLLHLWEYHNCTSNELYNTFTRIYSTDIQNGNEQIAHIWTQIRDQLSMTLQPSLHFASTHSPRKSYARTASAIGKLDVIRDQDIKHLQDILEDEIPKLRRYVAVTQSSQ